MGAGADEMKKIVTMHQPNYLPWIGLFSKLRQADCLVIADTFALGGQSVFNRNKVRTPNGWQYLTVPIGRKTLGMRICDVKLPADRSWRASHWSIIHDNYAKARFFPEYQDCIHELLFRYFEHLCELNLEIVQYLLKCFEIRVEVLRASAMSIDPALEKTDLMIALLKNAGADIYLSGPSGRDYLQRDKFPLNGIQLAFFEFHHPIYEQRFPGFEPNMSAIDLLFNTGQGAGEIIQASGSIEEE